MGNDDAVIGQLIDLYAEDSPRQLAGAVSALEQRDMAALARAAHSLKSTSASMGATAVSGMALELEHHAKQNDPAQAAAVIERLHPAVSNTIAAFARMKF